MLWDMTQLTMPPTHNVAADAANSSLLLLVIKIPPRPGSRPSARYGRSVGISPPTPAQLHDFAQVCAVVRALAHTSDPKPQALPKSPMTVLWRMRRSSPGTSATAASSHRPRPPLRSAPAPPAHHNKGVSVPTSPVPISQPAAESAATIGSALWIYVALDAPLSGCRQAHAHRVLGSRCAVQHCSDEDSAGFRVGQADISILQKDAPRA